MRIVPTDTSTKPTAEKRTLIRRECPLIELNKNLCYLSKYQIYFFRHPEFNVAESKDLLQIKISFWFAFS